MYAVTSGFLSEARKTNAPWVRKFTLGSSDYSNRVIRWPTVNRRWDEIKPQTVTIDLSNGDQLFNFFVQNPTNINLNGTVQLGFDYAVSSSEYLTFFQGGVDMVRISDGKCAVTFADKFKQLSDRTVGDTTTPANFTGSNYLVHDLAWYLVTSYGGYSAVTNSSNPDIDYGSFSSWTAIWSADNVRMRMYSKGKKVTDLIRSISRLTQSAIWVQDNKIKFERFTSAVAPVETLNADVLMESEFTIDDRSIVNKVIVGGDYNVASNTWGLTVSEVNTASVNSFGLRENNLSQTEVWFVNSSSALNTAQRYTLTNGQPFSEIKARMPLAIARATIGDTVTLDDAFLALNSTYRVMGEAINLQSGEVTFDIDQSQLLTFFRLDFSALDGTDVLG